MKERKLLIAVAALVIVVAIAFALASPRDRFRAGNDATEVAAADEEPRRAPVDGARLCASSAGSQQLKSAAFNEAIRVRGESGNLDRLAATSVVRMEGTEVTSEDADSGLVTCSGRFVIELPPGAERGFGGQRRLASDISFSVTPGAEGGAAAYRLVSADELVSSLAAFDIDSSLAPAPAEPAEVQVAEAAPPEEQLPVIIRREPAPERPEPRAEPERPAPPPARAEREQPKEQPKERTKERPAPPRPTPRPKQAEPRPTRYTSPSFDCRQAGTRSERLVCGSERLAAKDREMARYYFRSLNDADRGTRRELERTRNRFLRYRERCPNEACIADAYDGRMAEIRDIVAGIE